MIVKIVRNIHRVLGIVLGTLFFVWFASGLVMVYHTFPKVGKEDRIKRYDDLGNVSVVLPADSRTPLTLNSYLGRARVNNKVEEKPDVMAVARNWNRSEIARIDTLTTLEQWIPFDRYEKMMPIYKFYYDDEERHQLYVASTSGDVLQYTSSKGRFWAWLGAIPHWVYFTRLRQNTALWVSVVVWLSALGCVMCVAGMVMSLYDSIKTKRLVPFKKGSWFRWHHVLGISFGLVAFAFAFSGLMSLANISGWLPEPRLDISPQRVINQGVNIRSEFALDYKKVLREYPSAKELEWASVAEIPYYIVRTDSATIHIDGRLKSANLLSLTEQECVDIVRYVHGDSVALKVAFLTEYDSYYIGRKGSSPLPVWRIDVLDDLDSSSYYINPLTAAVKYVNYTAKVRHWLYPAVHSLRLTWLVKYPFLWSVLMWIFMLGGAALSFSGVWLGVRYICRILKNY